MLELFEKPKPTFSLSSAYIAFCSKFTQNEAIAETINLFFIHVLNDAYQYQIVTENTGLVDEKKSQTRTVSILKDNRVIGTATFQFSENSVKIISYSNLVISTIIREGLQSSQQLEPNEAFLKFGYSLEAFNQARQQSSKPSKSSKNLQMSFFGTITEKNEPHDLLDLCYEIGIKLDQHGWGWVSDSEELEKCSCILEALTEYVSTGKIELEAMKKMRKAASELKGANANIFRALLTGALAISVPAFITGVVVAVLAVMVILGGPITGAIAAVVIGISLSIILAGALYYYAFDQKEDFLSRAVIYLADKIQQESLYDNKPALVIPSEQLPDVRLSLADNGSEKPLPVFRPEPKTNPEQLFEELCENSLKPALAKASGNNNIDDSEVFNSLKEGLKTLYNQDVPIGQLKTKIEAAVAGEDQQEYLTALYNACGVEKPSFKHT